MISKRPKIILSLILFIGLVTLLSLMGSAQQPVKDPPLSGTPYELNGIPVGSWLKYSQNPIASFDHDIPTLKAFSDPSIIYDDGKYHLWFSCNTGEVSQICYALSNDGLKWKAHPEPVLAVGKPGSWDDYNSEVPTVIKDGNLYKMWYAGYSRAMPDHYNIGYTTSPDGIRWTRLPAKDSPFEQEGLVLKHDDTRQGEIGTIADPSVVKVNGTYHMWYNGFRTNMIAISHGTSKNGIHWERDPKNPVLTPSKPWEMIGDEGSVVQPSVLWDGTKFEIWYGSFADELQRYKAISHATSHDGTAWVKDDTPVLQPGPEDLWPSVSVVRVGNEVRLYYIGLPKLGEPPQLYLATRHLTSIVPKGDRMLSIDVNMAEDNDYDHAFRLAKEAGMQTVPLSINWKDIETSPGKYEDPGHVLQIANAYYPPAKTKVALYIRSVDTGSKPVPADLLNTPFTDPVTAERYLQMLHWVFSQIPDVDIEFLSVGDEMDLFWDDQKEQYREWGVFFKAVRASLKAKRPDLKIGFTITLYGLTRGLADEFKRINQESDVILVSYYPTDDKGLREPAAVDSDYDALVKMYPNRVIYIEQTGYPTSSLFGSSEAKQGEFIRETFRAWDKHREQIKYISFTWLHDLPQSALDFYTQYYGTSDESLLEFLRTLGFRTYTGKGEDKESFRAIKAEAKARGW